MGDVEIETAALSLLMATWEAVAVRGMVRRHLRKSGLSKQGRPREEDGDYVSFVAALDYEKLTASRVSRKIVPNAWKRPPCATRLALWRLARLFEESFSDFRR